MRSCSASAACGTSFFSKMTRQRIHRGIFRSIAELQAAISAYLTKHNASPNPSSGPNLPTPFWINSIAVLYYLFDSVH